MCALEEAYRVPEHEAVLCVSSRNYTPHAYRTDNTQARQLVIFIHVALQDSDIRPFERSLGARLGFCANETDSGFVQQKVAQGVGVGQRENDKIGIAWAGESAN